MSTWYRAGRREELGQKLVKFGRSQKLLVRNCQLVEVISECIDVAEEKDVVSIENQVRGECWDKGGNVADGENEEEWAQD